MRPSTLRRQTCGAVLLALAVTGCGAVNESQSKPEQSRILTTEEAQQEYAAAQLKWPLPQGQVYPPLVFKRGEDDLAYALHAPTGYVESAYLCAWQKEWLRSRNTNAAVEKAALKRINMYSGALNLSVLDGGGGRERFEQNMKAARLGDPGPIQNDVDLNCPD